MNKRQKRLRAEGLCIHCGASPRGMNRNTELPYTQCQECYERTSQSAKAREARLKKQGRCLTCETKIEKINPNTRKPYRFCEQHNTKNTKSVFNRRRQYKTQGRCSTCGNTIIKNSATRCRECADKRNQTRRDKRRLAQLRRSV